VHLQAKGDITKHTESATLISGQKADGDNYEEGQRIFKRRKREAKYKAASTVG